MIYKCLECGFETNWREEDFANKGNPVCPSCDEDMRSIECGNCSRIIEPGETRCERCKSL